MVKKKPTAKASKKPTPLRKIKRKDEERIIKELEQNLADFDHATVLAKPTVKFSDLPLSKLTLEGLRSSHYTETTAVQRQTIIPALKGKDILGAARTGSGKTLAFLIPVLENLYRNKWNQMDGLGALIISPTRELAIQIFQVLRRIGREHSFSAGLVIGGKDVQTESERLSRLNILIGTPGRLLQHIDQAIGFDVSNLQVLVLDEADRILDMGFKRTLDAIVEALPSTRQTMLFSATQTKTVSDLARLSLSEPEYISVDEESTTSTPKNLEQYYVVCSIDWKLDTLWSFLKSHLKTKILVFFSSSKQVRYCYETFRRLQPGIPLLHLHGKQKQQARIDITQKFSSSQNVCLFATDVVARGIDFPHVDWVIQVDAPEDAATYIHRVGRSARFDKSGRALLMLTESEEPAMLARLKDKKVPISSLTIKDSKKKSIQPDLQALCFKDPEIKYLGQKSFISYVRSIHVQKDKEIFKVEDLPLEDYAKSLGLPGAPKVKINKAASDRLKELKNAPRALLKGSDSDDDKEDTRVRTKYDRMFERKNQNVLSEHYRSLTGAAEEQQPGDGGEEDDDFMAIKRKDHNLELDGIDLNAPTSKRELKRALSRKLSTKNKGNPSKLVFDDEGNPHAIYELEGEEDFAKDGDAEEQKQRFLSKESEAMAQKDVEDKELAREKRLEKKRKRLEKLRALEEGSSGEDEEEVQVVLGSPRDHNDDYGYSDSDGEAETDDHSNKKARFDSTSDYEEDNHKGSKVLEVEQPETLQDLEALSRRLLRSS